MKKVRQVSMILEGGTFRTIYTSGVLDALMEEGIVMPYVVGISAGALNAVSYMSNQPGRTFEVFRKFRNDPRYMGVRNLFKEKSLFGLKFAYEDIPNEHIPFDWDAYYRYEGEVEFGVTNAITGEVEYHDAKKMDKSCGILRATCAIPFVFPEILLEGKPYYDGGLTDPIPVARAIDKGFEKHLMILTRPMGYRKSTDRTNKIAMKLLKKKYPNLIPSMQQRADSYNEALDRCLALEAEGKAFIFKPPHALKSFEKRVEVFTESYMLGYNEAKARLPELKKFLGIE